MVSTARPVRLCEMGRGLIEKRRPRPARSAGARSMSLVAVPGVDLAEVGRPARRDL